MKRFLRISSVLIMIIIMLLPINYGCSCYYGDWSTKKIDYDSIPEFVTEYSEEEHLYRIEDILIKYKGRFYNPIKNYTLHTLYSYLTEDPEYILVTIEHEKYFIGTVSSYDIWASSEVQNKETYSFSTKYSHTVIQIKNDKYYYATEYSNIGDVVYGGGFIYGKSAYEQCGYIDQKKFYCLGDQAIMTEQGLLVLYNSSDFSALGTYDFVEGIPRNEKEYEKTLRTENLKVLLYNSRYGYRASHIPREKFFED